MTPQAAIAVTKSFAEWVSALERLDDFRDKFSSTFTGWSRGELIHAFRNIQDLLVVAEKAESEAQARVAAAAQEVSALMSTAVRLRDEHVTLEVQLRTSTASLRETQRALVETTEKLNTRRDEVSELAELFAALRAKTVPA